MPDFIKEYPQHVSEDNAMAFLSEDGGETYNKCHCEHTLLDCHVNANVSLVQL